MRVLVEGYEGGLDDPPVVIVADVTMNRPSAYCGNHVWDYSIEEGDTVERCVVLPRDDYGPAEGRNPAVVWAAPVVTTEG